MEHPDYLRDRFRDEGRRLTTQRRLILEVLQNSERHLDVETLHERVRSRDPRVSLATIYRSLAILKDMGLVEEHSLGQEHAHYEAAQQAPHYHFICCACGRVIEFDSDLVGQAVQDFQRQYGASVTDTHLRLSGRCLQCRNLDKEQHNEA
ncbi:MAG: transcriptional repressor [Anaerolineales bacterium]|nr:transcriptional repressor [Anaerolineales bacterium]